MSKQLKVVTVEFVRQANSTSKDKGEESMTSTNESDKQICLKMISLVKDPCPQNCQKLQNILMIDNLSLLTRMVQTYLKHGKVEENRKSLYETDKLIKDSHQKLTNKMGQMELYTIFMKQKMDKKDAEIKSKDDVIMNLKKQIEVLKNKMKKSKILRQIGNQSSYLLQKFHIPAQTCKNSSQISNSFDSTQKQETMFFRTIHRRNENMHKIQKQRSSMNSSFSWLRSPLTKSTTRQRQKSIKKMNQRMNGGNLNRQNPGDKQNLLINNSMILQNKSTLLKQLIKNRH